MKLLIKTYYAGTVIRKTISGDFDPDYFLPNGQTDSQYDIDHANGTTDDYINPLVDIADELATIGKSFDNDRDRDGVFLLDEYGNGTETIRVRSFVFTIGTPSTIGYTSTKFTTENHPVSSTKYNVHEYAAIYLLEYLHAYPYTYPPTR